MNGIVCDTCAPLDTDECTLSFFVGSLDPYCEITVGALTLKTPFVKRTNHPKWNILMTFFLHNLEEDVIHINIFDNEFFSPNGRPRFC